MFASWKVYRRQTFSSATTVASPLRPMHDAGDAVDGVDGAVLSSVRDRGRTVRGRNMSKQGWVQYFTTHCGHASSLRRAEELFDDITGG
jgi:hypothetical protein